MRKRRHDDHEALEPHADEHDARDQEQTDRAPAHALEPFARRGIDLLKIEGQAVKGRPWEYCFYLDVRGSVNQGEVIETLDELNHSRVEPRILGAYRSASVPTR